MIRLLSLFALLGSSCFAKAQGGIGPAPTSGIGPAPAAAPAATAAASGFEHNAPTCDTADRKERNQYWVSSSESLYPIGPSSYSSFPTECSPPRINVDLVGAWYSLSIPAATEVVLDSTFYTMGNENSHGRSHYLAILKDGCDALTCVAHTYSQLMEQSPIHEASIDFKLTTNTHYYLFIAMADYGNGNMDAPTMGVKPTCEDNSSRQESALISVFGANAKMHCQDLDKPAVSNPPEGVPPDVPGLPQAVPPQVSSPSEAAPPQVSSPPEAAPLELEDEPEDFRPADGVSVSRRPIHLGLGDETEDFNVTLNNPVVVEILVHGEVGILVCELEPDDDDGDANLYMGMDRVPTTESYDCASTEVSTSEEECSVFLTTASKVYVLVHGNAQEVEVKCDMEDSSTEIDVAVDMATDDFDMEAGEYWIYYIDAPEETQSVSCRGNTGSLGLYMRVGEIPIPGTATDCVSTGTDTCEVRTSGGDVYVLAEAVNSVNNGQISCEVVLNPNRQSLDEDDADELDLGDEEEFELLANEARLFYAYIPQGATKVSCSAWSSANGLSYAMTVSDSDRDVIPRPGGSASCSSGGGCEHTFNGGNPRDDAWVYVAVSSTEGARNVNVRCEADLLDVEGDAEFLAWGDEASDKKIKQGDGTLFYLIVPIGTQEYFCSTRASQGDLDLYVRLDTPPDLYAWDCRPFSTDASEECSFRASPSSYNRILYVEIRAYESSLEKIEDAVVTCRAFGNGVYLRGSRHNPDLP